MSKVLVVGDVMLDEYIYGDVKRISPEAATPVLSVTRETRMVGGAGNVARGVAALDVDCDLLGVVGCDRSGNELVRTLADFMTPRLTPWVLMDQDRQTTHKTRYVSDAHSSHLLRVDAETVQDISIRMERELVVRALSCLKDADVLVLSDYCKGVVTSNVAMELIRAARLAHKIVIVDSKRTDLSLFEGATVVKLNESEFQRCEAEADVVGGVALARYYGVEQILLTRGERGLTCYSAHHDIDITVKGRVVKVRDVSGAGDTVVATLAAMLAGGCMMGQALRRANHAASVAVGKPGTATVTRAELANDKIAPASNWALMYQRLTEWKPTQRIGYVNGCFDLLHRGHVSMLTEARARCDKLIVGLNSDYSVGRIKGKGRPIQSEADRALMLAALDCVDLVVVFDDDTPEQMVKAITPHTLFKGTDYQGKDIAEARYADNIEFIERAEDGPSTTQTIEKVKAHAAD